MQSKETKVLKLSKNVKKLLNKGDYVEFQKGICYKICKRCFSGSREEHMNVIFSI